MLTFHWPILNLKKKSANRIELFVTGCQTQLLSLNMESKFTEIKQIVKKYIYQTNSKKKRGKVYF
jgi:hypothetical protein